jgi:hypothetical protein
MAMVATVDVCQFGAVTALASTAHGIESTVVAGGQDGSVTLLRGPTLVRGPVERFDGGITAACALPRSEGDIALALAGGRLAVVRISRGGSRLTKVANSQVFNNEILAIAPTVLAGRTWVVACGLDRTIKLVDPYSGIVTMSVATDGYGLSVAAHRRTIAVGSSLGATVLDVVPDSVGA